MVVVDPQIRAESQRLLLRPLVMDDAAAIRLIRSDPETMLHTPLKPSDDIEITKAWIQGCHTQPNNWNFAIELLPSAVAGSVTPSAPEPRVIGMIGAVRAPEVGYMLSKEHWGKGYATEALRAFMPLFFEHFSGKEEGVAKYDFAEAHTDTELVSSQGVLKKAGFKLVEEREKDFDNPVLGLRDTFIFTLDRPA